MIGLFQQTKNNIKNMNYIITWNTITMKMIGEYISI